MRLSWNNDVVIVKHLIASPLSLPRLIENLGNKVLFYTSSSLTSFWFKILIFFFEFTGIMSQYYYDDTVIFIHTNKFFKLLIRALLKLGNLISIDLVLNLLNILSKGELLYNSPRVDVGNFLLSKYCGRK